VERPASRREPPVRGDGGPQRGKAPRAGSWGCWASRAAPRVGRRPAPGSAGPAGRAACGPRRGTRPACRHPRAPAGGPARGARGDAGPSRARDATRRTPRSGPRPRARRDGPGTAVRQPAGAGPRAPVPAQRGTTPAPGGPWARVARTAAERCGRCRCADRPGGRRRAAGRCGLGGLGACRRRRRPGRGSRSARPGCCRCRVRAGRRACVPRCPGGPSRCSCRLLPHVASAAGEGAADKEKGRDRRRIRRASPAIAQMRVTEPLRSNSEPVGDPFRRPMTCRQEVHSERGNGRKGRRSSPARSGTRGVSAVPCTGGRRIAAAPRGTETARPPPRPGRRGDHPGARRLSR